MPVRFRPRAPYQNLRESRENPYKLHDGEGLYLLVHPNGSKYWRFKYRFHGKEKLLALGVYPDVPLAKVRERVQEARKLIADKTDPSEVRKREKRKARERACNTFEALGQEWFEQRKGGWSPNHAARVLASLEKEVFPRLGHRPVAEIEAMELLEVLREIERRGALEIASRVLQRCSAVFRYAAQTGRCKHSVAADLQGALKTPERKHYSSLSTSDLPEFLRKVADYDGHLQTRLGLRLLLLTATRTVELRAARWEEFDFDNALWRIPAERMKTRRAHIVPLSKQALETLETLKTLNGLSSYLFPNRNRPETYMSENTLLYALYRMGYHSRATGHGFRATFSTIMNEMGYRDDVIERQLAHDEQNKVRAAYNRAKYLEERRVLMQAWADHLDALAQGAPVIPSAIGRPRTSC